MRPQFGWNAQLEAGSKLDSPSQLPAEGRRALRTCAMRRSRGERQREWVVEFPSMGQSVKAYLTSTLSAHGLADSVFYCSSTRLLSSAVALDPRFFVGFPDDIAAGLFSAFEREPSFYRGLIGPWLRSALQGGIAYPKGLRHGVPGPEIQWMLSPVTITSVGYMPTAMDLHVRRAHNPER